MEGSDANWKKMESSMHDLTWVMRTVAKNNSHNETNLFKDFRSLDPPRFTGSTDLDEAENWLKDIERIFKVIRCTEEETIRLATFLDRSNAKSVIGIFLGFPALSCSFIYVCVGLLLSSS